MSHLAAQQPSKRRLWTFHGGLHVPDEKALSSEGSVESMPLPPRLVIPLAQHIGAPAQPCVQVGDRVLKGQLIATPDGYVSAAVHASSSGTVVAIEPCPVPHPSGLAAPCIVIETDGEDAWADLPQPLTDYVHLDPAVIRERVRWAGVVGLGGASFPTSVKLNPGPDRRIKTLIINGAECEPYITCDDRLMRERSPGILEGVRILRHLVGAEQILIAVEDNKPAAISAMEQALGATDLQDAASVVPIPTLYPSGGERQLIRVLTGLEVPTQGLPAHLGILCQNVGTALAIADAVLRGRPLITRVVTVSGRAIVAPGNLEVPLGTPVSAALTHRGGYRHPPRKLLCGGPMMGFELSSPDAPVTKAVNCVLALTPTEAPDPGPPIACIRCGSCAEVCPVRLLPQQLYWHARSRDLDRVQDYSLFDCIECGCCAAVCPSHIPLVHYYRYAKTEVWAREQERRKAEQARLRHEARMERLERLERARKAKLRQKKEALEGGSRSAPVSQDPKRAAIEAAKQRVAVRKQALHQDQSERATGAGPLPATSEPGTPPGQ